MYAIWDCGHLIFFIAIVAIVSRKFDVNKWKVVLLLSIGVFLGGGLIELIQAYIGRDGSWSRLRVRKQPGCPVCGTSHAPDPR